jgi:ABC-type transporter Mla subunit MlaD
MASNHKFSPAVERTIVNVRGHVADQIGDLAAAMFHLQKASERYERNPAGAASELIEAQIALDNLARTAANLSKAVADVKALIE